MSNLDGMSNVTKPINIELAQFYSRHKSHVGDEKCNKNEWPIAAYWKKFLRGSQLKLCTFFP